MNELIPKKGQKISQMPKLCGHGVPVSKTDKHLYLKYPSSLYPISL